MTDGPSRAEFEKFVDRLDRRIEHGFEQINERLDVLNGRIGKGEVADAELRTRLTNVEKEIFSRPRRRADDQIEDEREDETKRERRDRKREAALITAGLAIITALIELAKFLASKTWEVLKLAGKV